MACGICHRHNSLWRSVHRRRLGSVPPNNPLVWIITAAVSVRLLAQCVCVSVSFCVSDFDVFFAGSTSVCVCVCDYGAQTAISQAWGGEDLNGPQRMQEQGTAFTPPCPPQPHQYRHLGFQPLHSHNQYPSGMRAWYVDAVDAWSISHPGLPDNCCRFFSSLILVLL